MVLLRQASDQKQKLNQVTVPCRYVWLPVHISLRVQKPLQLVSRSGEAASGDSEDVDLDEPTRLTAVRRIALEWRSAWDPHSGLNLPGTSLKYREGRARVHRLGGHKGRSAADPDGPGSGDAGSADHEHAATDAISTS